MRTLPSQSALQIHYAMHHRRTPNLRRPTRFTEKIIHRKLFDRDERLPLLVDKIAVKSFVAAEIGSAFVTPTLWSGERLPPPGRRNWQIPFVLKANNGSGTNVFVRDPADVDWPTIEAKCGAWLRTSHADWAGEWAYAQVKPRLLVEPLIAHVSAAPLDYKFFAFAGKVHCIQVDTDRETDHKRTFFDRDWNRLHFALGWPVDPRPIEAPKHLARMIDAAATLSRTFPFVRVDLYDTPSGPLFGEMTFYPDAGIFRFLPDRYDFEFGELWT